MSSANVSQFAQPKKHHEQQCVRNNVSSFATAFSHRNTEYIIRKVKHDVYGKRQTTKMKLLSRLSSLLCIPSDVKLFVFAMNSKWRYSTFACFIYGLKEKTSKSEVVFAVCRLPYALTSCLTSVKHDLYGKRQTAKMKLFPSLFSCVYSRVKLFVIPPLCVLLTD